MNIKPLHNFPDDPRKEFRKLFCRMESSLKNAKIDVEKSIRLAKTLAPLLSDQSSNEKHISVITSDAPIEEKVIAILMLGFPKNRPTLPLLANLLKSPSESIRMASAIAIAQMRDGQNNDVLLDILHAAFLDEASSDVKKALRNAMLLVMDEKSASLVASLSKF